jgi:hypothetical protein
VILQFAETQKTGGNETKDGDWCSPSHRSNRKTGLILSTSLFLSRHVCGNYIVPVSVMTSHSTMAQEFFTQQVPLAGNIRG